MGEKTKETLKLQFDKRLRLEFHGARITSDAGLLTCRELNGVLGLTEMAPSYLRETRGGRFVAGFASGSLCPKGSPCAHIYTAGISSSVGQVKQLERLPNPSMITARVWEKGISSWGMT